MKKTAFLAVLLLFAALSLHAQDVAVFPQLGHSLTINSLCLSPDGKYVLSGAADNTVKLWDFASGKEIRTFAGHTGIVKSVAFSPDGKQVLSGSNDKTMKLWDVATGTEIKTFSEDTLIDAVAFSPNGKQVTDGYKLWDIASGSEIATFRHINVYAVAFSPDGKQIISGGGKGAVKLWDAASGKEIRTFTGHTEFVKCVAFSPDGKQVLSGAWDNTVKLWNAATGKEIRTFSGHRGGITSVSFSPDGKQILSSSFNDASRSTFKIWDAATGRELKTFAIYNTSLYSVIFTPDGKQVLYAEGSTIILSDIATGNKVRAFDGLTRSVNSAVFCADGKQFFSTSQGGIKRWDAAAGREVSTFGGTVTFARLSPNGKQLLSGNYSTMTLRDAATDKEITSFKANSIHSAAFSPDGKQIVFGDGKGAVKLWDVATGAEVKTFTGHTDLVNSVAFSPDGKQVLSRSHDKTIKLWDVATGKEIKTFASVHTQSVRSVVFSPDGNQFLSGSQDNTMKLWDIASGQEVRTFAGHKGWVNSVCFSANGRQILSASNDNTVKLWDAATGKEVKTFSGHAAWVAFAAFSPDEKRIISASYDDSVRMWDVATGKEIAQFISFRDGEWVVITPEGFYNSSPNGEQYLNVRVGLNVYGIDQYRQTFYKPALVALALGGDPNAYLASAQKVAPPPAGKTAATIQDASIAPPAVTVSSPSSVTSGRTKISVSVNGGSQSIQNLVVKVNGKIIARDFGVTPAGAKAVATMAKLDVLASGNANKKQASFDLDIPLDAGNNIIEVLAFNGYSEGRGFAEVSYATSQGSSLPNLYILSVGVSNYADNSIPSLRYAANDARGIVKAFKAQEGKRYGSVKSLILADGGDREPTRDNISDGMDFLRGAGQNDVMILFLSGHGGTDDQGSFFFMPRNMAFTDSGAPQRSRLIPNSELQDVLRFPGQKVVFIDSCFSGGITGKQVGGVDNEVLINSLREDSPVIFTSSSKQERSWEWESAKLGLFTHVLLDGFSGKADSNKDGKITIAELGDYVKKTVPSMKDTQTPYYLAPVGYRDFVIAHTK